MTQHRSYRRSIPLWSWRPCGAACCISNIWKELVFKETESHPFYLRQKKSLFSVKTSTDYLLSTCYTNPDLLEGIWWYSPQLRWASFTGWRVITALHCIPSNHSWRYSSVHTYPTCVVLPFLTCPGTLPFINTTAWPALQSHILNTLSVMLFGEIWDWLLYKQCSKMLIYCLYCSLLLSPAPNFLYNPLSLLYEKPLDLPVLPGLCTNWWMFPFSVAFWWKALKDRY